MAVSVSASCSAKCAEIARAVTRRALDAADDEEGRLVLPVQIERRRDRQAAFVQRREQTILVARDMPVPGAVSRAMREQDDALRLPQRRLRPTAMSRGGLALRCLLAPSRD